MTLFKHVLFLTISVICVDVALSCELLNIPICQELNWNNYTHVRFPNEMGHTEQDSAAMELQHLEEMIDSGCSQDIRAFLCSLYAPGCHPDGIEILPCRDMCINVRDRCEPFMTSKGFEWPNQWRCGRFPVDNEMCIISAEKAVTLPIYTPDAAVTTQTPTEPPEAPEETDVYNPNINRPNICRQDQLYCDNNCVPLLWRCDKFMDCEDGADERDCDKCLSNQFKCADRSQCIPLSSRCDTFADCSDQSDEENCNTCSGVEFECDRNRCIPQSFRCDSKHDCTDRTDELDCGECFAGEFKCANNRCIDSSQKCDGSDDCGDGSDEPSTCYNVGPDAPSQKTPLDNNSAVSPCSTAHMNCNMNSECKQEMDNYRKVCEKQMASPQMMTCSKSCYNAYYMLLSKQPHGKELLDRECNELYVAHVELSCIRQPAAMSCMNEVTKCSQNNMCEKMYRRYSSSCKEVLDQHDPCSEVCLTDYQILRESPLAKDIVSNCIEVNTTIPMRCGATQMSTSRGNGDSACSKLYTAALTLSMVVALFTGS